MRNLLLTFLLLALGLFSTVSAQVNGEYRSVSSGDWNSASSWEQFNGTWAPAISAPNSTTAVVTVQSGHTLTMSAPAQVRTLYLNGIITTSSINTLTIYYLGSIIGGSTTAYIDGPLNYQVSSASGSFKILNLPLGKGSVGRPAELKVGHNRTNLVTYTIEMFNSAPPARTLPAALASVSSVRYYTISRNLYPTVTSNINLTLTYDTDDGVGTANSLLRVVRDNGTAWADLGGTGTAETTGKITTTTVTPLLPTNTFALASAFVQISGNAGVGGATLSWFDGAAKTTTSAANGAYSIYVPGGWTGTLTPSLQYYNFTPSSLTFNNVTTNQINQNFAAASIFTQFRTAGPGDWNDPLIWEVWTVPYCI